MKSEWDKTWSADFETTGHVNFLKDGFVRVWLWSLVKLDGSEEYYGRTIEEFLFKVKELKCKKIFFYNLGFDGMFLIDYLCRQQFEYGKYWEVTIDHLNVFYEMKIFFAKGKPTLIWDALKKFPGMSLEAVAKMFGIAGKTLTPEEKEKVFNRYIPEDYQPTPEEIEYCLQDSRICSYAILQKYKQGFDSMTLSADAFQMVKRMIGGKSWKGWRKQFPLLSKEQDMIFREAYLGGFVQVNENKIAQEVKDVYCYDVNSLYPFVYSGGAGKLPYGQPFRKEQVTKNQLYFIRVAAEFELKDGYFPILQVKNSWLYKPTEFIKQTSEPLDRFYTSVEWKLLNKFYKVTLWSDPEYYCFFGKDDLLKEYVDYWINEKIEAGKAGDKARRKQAKLMLNSPYGKTGMRGDRINKIPYLDEYGDLMFKMIQDDTDAIYVPFAAFTTAKAREICINCALANKENWLYSDTDSCYLTTDSPKGIEVDDYKLGAWAMEGHYDRMKFLRPKTYIGADRNYNIQKIACAGLPDEARVCINWDNFNIGQTFEIGKVYNGIEFKGKLMKHRVPGGVVLLPTGFQIKENLLTRRGF